MAEPAYLIVSLFVSSVGFVMLMYGRKQSRPVQFGAGLVLLLIPYFVRDPLWLSLVGVAVCALVWGAVKAGL
jgi:hypothetical protein